MLRVGSTVVFVSDGCVLGQAMVLSVNHATKTLELDHPIPYLCSGVEVFEMDDDRENWN